ncbi:MAG TPA: hypothetical protein VFJ19_00305 [Nocardioidaceae bacterium]|nr:hypothetical protein [Nocardioidaceae bacterium]
MDTWLTLKQAADRTGLTAETIRKWAISKPPRVRGRTTFAGKRKLWQVEAGDVDREAEANGRMARRSTRRDDTNTRSRDRTATLNDVTRIYRLIDELREEIESRHLQIERLQREVVTLLEAPSVLTND